jgi:hypothetical protein
MSNERLTLEKINAVRQSAPLQETQKQEDSKRRVGRPSKTVDKKNKAVPSYYTETEYQLIKQFAKERNMSLGLLQRKIFLKYISNQGVEDDDTN